MTSGAIANDVERFLLDSIDTIPHLEALLLIFQAPASSWAVDEVAARIYVTQKEAGAILEDLARRSLIARVEQVPAKYQFVGRSEAQTQFLQTVADTYRTQLVRVTRLVHSNASSQVRDFARAFLIKDGD